MIQIERQKFRCPIFCNKYSCYDRIFLAAFPVSRRNILRQNPQRMGNNHSSYNHSLCCSPCGSMDWLGFGFYSTAPTSHGRTFRKLENKLFLHFTNHEESQNSNHHSNYRNTENKGVYSKNLSLPHVRSFHICNDSKSGP